MEKKDFKNTMEFLAGAYRDKRYTEDNTLDAWYRVFSRFDSVVFDASVASWVNKEPKSPNVSDLIMTCKTKQRKNDEGIV